MFKPRAKRKDKTRKKKITYSIYNIEKNEKHSLR